MRRGGPRALPQPLTETRMIEDQAKLLDYQKDWSGVRDFQKKIQRHLNAASIGIGGLVTHDLG